MEIPLSSIFLDGGLVTCIRCLVSRVYPLQFLEKYEDGSVIIRNSAGEEKALLEYEKIRRKSIDNIIEQVQQERCTKNRKRSAVRQKKMSICDLGTGQELLEAMKASEDPSYFQESLTSQQMALLMAYKEKTNDETLQEEVRKAVTSDERFPKERRVVSLLKVRITGIRDECSVMFTVWRPSEDLLQLLQEGNTLRIHHILPRRSKFKDSELEMNSTKNTRYDLTEIDESIQQKIYKPREVARIGHPKVESEIDIVGVVFHVSANTSPFQDVYLTDSELNVLCIRIWCGVKRLHAENILNVGKLVCATNLKVRQATLPHTAYANDISAFTVKPKASYLQAAVSVFQSKDISRLVKSANERLVKWQELKRPSVASMTPPLTRCYPTYSPLCLRRRSETKSEHTSMNAREKIARLEQYDSALPLPELRIRSSRKALSDFKPPFQVKSTPNRTSPPMDLD